MSTALRLAIGGVAVAFAQYPVTITNCGVSREYAAAPKRAITMNQGATEFMLAMGLEGSMVGTAYLDDAIWPKYAQAYSKIPVLSSAYPNETYIMKQNPDFIIASYNSAFRYKYESGGKTRGVFNETVAVCTGTGSDWSQEWTTCRPQLHAKGISTYLSDDACEDQSLRPATVTEETVYAKMRSLGKIFNVDPEAKITEMKGYFDQAAGIVSSGNNGAKLKTVWLDCVGRCCNKDPNQVFVGGGTGAPNLLMKEAGLENVFAGKTGNWVCVSVSDIVAAKPDVFVVVDAAWDTAVSKLEFMYNHSSFCELDVLKAARFVKIPFSATTLSPRNGPAAVDLAVAALHVRTGSQTAQQKSGVASFSPFFLQHTTSCLKCPLLMWDVKYTDAEDKASNYKDGCPIPTTTMMVSKEANLATHGRLGPLAALAAVAVVMMSA